MRARAARTNADQAPPPAPAGAAAAPSRVAVVPADAASTTTTTTTTTSKAELAAEFHDMVVMFMVAVITYGGRTFTTLLVNDLVASEESVDEGFRFMLLSAFYWGYAPPQLFGGWLAQKLGGKSAMVICLLGMTMGFLGSWALLAAPQSLLPLDLPTRLTGVAVLRFIDGLCQCLYVPTTYIIFRARVAPSRVSKYRAMMSLGARTSRFAAAALEPWLVHGVFLSVAPVFAVLGGLSVTVLGAFAALLRPVSERAPGGAAPPPVAGSGGNGAAPTTTGGAVTAASRRKRHARPPPQPPIPLFGPRFWKLILYLPSIACAVVHFTSNWIQALVEAYSLRFYTEVANTSLVNAAIYNSSPHTVGFVSPFVCVAMEVFLQRYARLSPLGVLRAHSCLALAVVGAAMAVVSGSANSSVFFWAMVATLFGNGLHTAGYSANYISVGGGQSGILSAAGNSFANLAGLMVPWVVYKLKTDAGDWTLIYPTTAALCAASGLLYFFTASTEPALGDGGRGEAAPAAAAMEAAAAGGTPPPPQLEPRGREGNGDGEGQDGHREQPLREQQVCGGSVRAKKEQ